MSGGRPVWFLNRRELLKLLPPSVAGLVLGPLVQEELARATPNAVAGPEAEGKKWVANWIWCEGEPVPQNFYLYCRKSFTLEGNASDATIDVTADSRYKLFVNGKFVGRGPVRSDQRWQYYDTYNLAPFLRGGENVVTAVVHQFGVPRGSYTLGRGGFLLQGELRGRGGRNVRLDSDETWRVLPSLAWDRDVPPTSPGIMWMEVYDARKEPVGWQQPGFDDSSWQKPVILGTHPVMPWEHLVARDIPFLLEEEWLPAGVVNSGLVDPAPPPVHLDIPKLLGRSDGQVAYLFAYLKSPVEQEMAVAVRSIDGMPFPMTRMWLNGQDPAQVQGPPPAVGPTVSTSLLKLRQGWNELLIKLGRMSPAWTWDLAFGPFPGQTFTSIEWHADSQEGSSSGQAWIMGPYGQDAPSGPGGSQGPGSLGTPYEPEKVILDRTPGTPVRLPGKTVVLDSGAMKNVALLMAMEERHPQSTDKLQHIERLLKPGNDPALISTAGGNGDPYVTLDFGKEVAGFVRLRLNGVAGGIVDLGYCETLVDGHVDTLRDQWSFADRYIMRDGPQEWELFFWKGLRYLQLTFRNCSKPVELESVRLLFTSYPVKYRGSFECSDSLLTKIWEVGRWTLQLCMHDCYEDCPWREQTQWVGDAQVELPTNYVTFGDLALGTKYLRQITQGQGEKGNLPAAYPSGVSVFPTHQSAPPEGTLPTFNAQWVSTFLGHYRFTGDRKLVSELFPAVVRLMAYFDGYLGAHGLLVDVPGFPFLDWAQGQMEFRRGDGEELTGLNAHYYRALVDAAELASLMGDGARQAEWMHKADSVKQSINERLWSEEKGAYVHGRRGDQKTERLAVHESVLAVYSGVAPEDRVQRSLDTLFGKRSLDAIPIGSPFFYFFYLQALRRAGRHQQALDAMRQAYSKMLDAGATTWWENFEGFASLCHAWSTAPNSDLSAHVLGVQLTEPAFAAFRVEPYPADLTWAKGIVPTPHGDVSVNWKREGSTFELNVAVPMEALVELSVPAKSLETSRMTSKTRSQKREFTDGRARYWVQGPGTFRIEAQG